VLYHCGAVRMCACHGIEQKGRIRTERRYCNQSLNLSGCRVLYSVSLGTGSLGLRDRSAIPASVPGPVWLSATGHRACPRVRRRAQPAHPLSTTTGVARIHTPVMCTIPPFKTLLAHPWGLGRLRGRTAFRRERRVGCSMDSSCELLCVGVWRGSPCTAVTSTCGHKRVEGEPRGL
jgi:hypothetical protein